jgi:hypothetical protein
MSSSDGSQRGPIWPAIADDKLELAIESDCFEDPTEEGFLLEFFGWGDNMD